MQNNLQQENKIMGTITAAEYLSLPSWQRVHYLENKDYEDYKVIEGNLCVVKYPSPRISWERFHELLNALEYTSYNSVPDGASAVYGHSNLGDWNSAGMKYTEYGFEYSLWLEVRHPDYSKEGKQAQKQILIDWLQAHGATEDEMKSIYWNWHGYSAKFICRFTEVPRHYLPEKVLKWLKRNPQWKHKILKPEREAIS